MIAAFDTAVAETLDALKLPECCDQYGKPYHHKYCFFGRLRVFRVVCPRGHDTYIRVWAPPGKKWPQ